LPASPELAAALRRIVAERQADRLPSVAAAVGRAGEVVWSDAVGAASYAEDREATPDTQYRIGSITKTFTAVAVMQLRDEGLLDLDDRLDDHLPDAPPGSPTVRRLLAHLSGYQREIGDMWLTGEVPTDSGLLEALAGYERVLPAARMHHYSNLGFALLGAVVARRSGMPYTTYVDERIIRPLGLERTTWQPELHFAQGFLVDEYARTVAPEPATDLGGTAAAGQLWSTAGDLVRWADVLARGKEGVLAAKTVEEMWAPQVMRYPEDWSLAWGLGLMLTNHEGRIYGGHGGAMPGHLAGVRVERKTGVAAAALTNSGTRGEMDLTAVRLAAKTIELEPPEIAPWRPEDDPPADVRALLGRWWSEGNEYTLWWEGGAMRAQSASAPATRPPAIFEREGEGWRAVSGLECGEVLRVVGDELTWAGYRFTRDQRPFQL
jgi:CubicO group peptidase (beta-lactamase class C family)